MELFQVEGGHRLQGEIIPQGAKNEALQILCAVMLTPEEVTISNVPDIKDVNLLIELLEEMGVAVNRVNADTYTFKAENINLNFFQSEAYLKKAGSLRGSIMIAGAMLGRFKKAWLARPGGDKIGRRRLDTHFIGLQNLGAELEIDRNKGLYYLHTSALKGTYMLLDEASVTGTANIIMAAVLAEGKTSIYNAACEPYIQQLCKMLNNMGAHITGIGSNFLHIEGVKELQGCKHKILPDMIEVGSFIGMAAMTGSEITIKDVSFPDLGQIPATFGKLGIQYELRGDDIYIPKQDSYEIQTYIDGSILNVADAIWPGFTPDLLSIVLVVATQAKGSVLIHQKMFESRLFFVDKLIDMGAQIILCDPHRAAVIGLNKQIPLKGISMTSPDIRAGVSLLIAAMSAEGDSKIYNINQIDRGYQHIDKRLNAIGAKIQRIVE